MKVNDVLSFLGFSYRTAADNITGLRFFLRDLRKLKKQLEGDKQFPITRWLPILNERYSPGGTLSGHYFHQDLLIAKKIYQNRPVRHVDIGSRTDGFVAHVAAFREIEIIDIRQVACKVPNIRFIQADFMNLQPDLIDYTDSISSLHAIEHFGLGRYNDPIDAYGHVKGLNNIYSVLKRGGRFYFSAPIGTQRIEFNGQRVFSISYLLKLFEEKYRLDTFSFVDDNGNLHESVALTDMGVARNFGCHYGCGIFEFTKL